MGKSKVLSTPDPCSQEAAQRIAPVVDSIKTQIWKHVKANPGITCEATSADLALKWQTCSARFTDLVNENRLTYDVLKGADGRTMRRYRVVTDTRQMEMFRG